VAAKKAVKKTSKSAPVKKASAKEEPVAKKVTATKVAMTKSGVLDAIAGNTGLTKKQVSSVFGELSVVIERHIKKGAAGKFALPGLIKIEVKRKPATKARKGINPFTGKETVFKAKPARNVVKIRPLKKLKDMVA
jgi:nucleoid DNA-binding protein